MPHDLINGVILLMLLLPSALIDIRTHRIPNAISLSGWIVGPSLYTAMYGWHGLKISLLGLAIVLSITFPFFALNWLGAGDVKLMTSVGAIVGVDKALYVLLGIVFTGAVMALFMLLHSRLRRNSQLEEAPNVMAAVADETKIPQAAKKNEQQVLPYAVPIAIGTFLTMAIYYAYG